MPLENLQQIDALIPLPNMLNQRFCDTVSLAPGFVLDAYVPTAAERFDDLPAFEGLLVDPETNLPFPGGIIPGILLGPGIYAWRIPPQDFPVQIVRAVHLAHAAGSIGPPTS